VHYCIVGNGNKLNVGVFNYKKIYKHLDIQNLHTWPHHGQ
jgi:hypothetical protein